jgi:hypothetical protein
MTRLASRTLTLALALAALGSGCAPQQPESHADAVAAAACKQHVDRVYAMQNPDAVFRQDNYETSTRDTPFSGAGMPGLPSAGLSAQFQRDQMYGDCVNGGHGTIGAAPEGPPPVEAPGTPASGQP